MGDEGVRGAGCEEPAARLPLGPIEDEGSYRAALAILDRLFELDDRRTQAQMDDFRALARLAYEYERARDPSKMAP